MYKKKGILVNKTKSEGKGEGNLIQRNASKASRGRAAACGRGHARPSKKIEARSSCQ